MFATSAALGRNPHWISIEFVKSDPDTAHDIVVATSGSASEWLPKMSANPAFSGVALWFLHNPTSAGMHEGTVAFTASTAGTYQYLCPVLSSTSKRRRAPPLRRALGRFLRAEASEHK